MVYGRIISLLQNSCSLLLAKTMVTPIESLTHAAEKVAMGDFSETVENSAKDEIGVLSRTFNDMANQLQRTPNSILIKLKALGLYVPTPMPPRWTEEDDKKVVDMYTDGCPFEDISEALGRSVNAVIQRLIHLRVKIFNDYGR